MSNLQFADTHNLVAFLAKPAESEGFEQIVDFHNAHTIKYALTINPTIYTSCIEQFWSTIKAKTVNEEVYDLQLDDEEGMDCFPNATIFEELTRMGAKTKAWNEFSSTMASAIICLATNQKFNFSKYIFESMVKNLDSVGNFLMYPRFVQVFLEQQVGKMSNHKRIYVTPSHTKKIFGNMRRIGKGFSGRETSLFPTMMVEAKADMGEGSTIPTDPHHTPTITQPSSSQPQNKQRPKKPKRKDTEIPQSSGPTNNVADKTVNEEMNDSLVRAATTASSLEVEQDSGNIDKTQSKETPNEPSSLGTSSGGGPRHQETIGDTSARTRFERVSKLSNDPLLARDLKEWFPLMKLVWGRYGDDQMFDVSDIAGEEVFVAEQGVPDIKKDDVVSTIDDAAQTVQEKSKGKMVKPKPVKKFSKKDQIRLDEELAFKLQAKEKEILAREKDEANVTLTEEWNGIQAKIEADQLLAKRLQAREQEELTIKEWAKLFQQLLEKRRKHFAAKRAEEKRNRPLTKAQQRSIITELVEGTEEEEGTKKAEAEVIEAKLQSLMKIVPDEEEVAIDAIPLATKPPSIVAWKIIKEGKINNFQIIRADESLKRYSAFIQMLKSFDKEDLETLWKLVKAKHGSIRSEEGYERVLWGDLKTMFEHHVEDTVWRNLQGQKVLIWKLFDSRGVHFMRLQSTHIFMLVEKKYPLTPAIITDMLNNKLQADHWNVMVYSMKEYTKKKIHKNDNVTFDELSQLWCSEPLPVQNMGSSMTS
ncbi:hypothetical protein Tco_0180967 [Tanacetum coccineum]